MTQTLSLNKTLGAIEIGGFIAIILFGVLCVQIYAYYRTFGSQLNILDIAVAIIGCLDLGHTICLAHTIYVATITWSGDAGRLDELITVPSMPLTVLFSALVEFVVRMVYIMRIQKFSGKRCIPALCYVMSAVTCLGGIGVGVAAFNAKTISGFIQQWAWLHTATISTIVVSDGIIATAMCYYLWKAELWLERHSKLTETLSLWTIETGLLTSLTALSQLICFLTMRSTTLAFMAIYMSLPKLYSNSLLALLNGRAALRNRPSSLNLYESGELVVRLDIVPAPSPLCFASSPLNPSMV